MRRDKAAESARQNVASKGQESQQPSSSHSARSSSNTPRARLSRAFSFGRSKKKPQDDSDVDVPAPAAQVPPAAALPSSRRRILSFTRKKTSKHTTTDPAVDHDGRYVGEEIKLQNVTGREDLEGLRGEAILYDFYECMYTVILEHNGRRLQVAPQAVRKA